MVSKGTYNKLNVFKKLGYWFFKDVILLFQSSKLNLISGYLANTLFKRIFILHFFLKIKITDIDFYHKINYSELGIRTWFYERLSKDAFSKVFKISLH